ncbi:MAG: FHA domain-containing protein, partial [Aliifodinibius sp.]|nr:FHA domain-containing protein [Fodinibius sp.]NIV13995.1 FHA domain-containing protein [Fodinibius sp.]NIY27838.1 FHA domain-containing protein [Fodinibius sp.]
DDGIFKLNGNYTTVGRDVNNDIVIKDGKISKRHAAIFEEEGEIIGLRTWKAKTGFS